MLEKNKDYVEFTLQCSSVDWAGNKNHPEVSLSGYSDFSFPGVPMDVVCKEFDHEVVVVGKREFERLQTENEELKKKLHEFDPIPEYKEILKKLYTTEDVEKLEWTLNHICGGQASVNGWMASAKFWRQNCETLSKLVGFSSVEEIEDYLVNEAECDTLREAISKLKDQVKYTCDEWYSANRSNNSWKAAAECNSPKELIEKLNLLRDDISGRCTVIEHYKRDIEKWQKATGCLSPEDISTDSMISKSMANEINTANEKLWRENEKCEKRIEALLSEIRERRETTGCPSPSSAKTLIESGASWHHAFNEAKEKNRKLIKEVDSWKYVTGYSTPEDYMHTRINNKIPFDYTSAWQKATGCPSPLDAKNLIEETQAANEKFVNDVESWQHVTGYPTPEDFLKWKANIEGIMEAWKSGTGCKYPAEARILLEKWKTLTKCETPEAAATLIASYKSSAWQDFTGCTSPQEAGLKINNLCNEIWELKDRCGFHKEREWKEFTGAKSPEDAKKRIKALQDEIDELTSDYSHLLTLTGFDNEGEIEDFLEGNNDRNKLTTVIDDLKRENESMKEALRASNSVMLKELENNIDEWQKATGRIDPEAAKQYIDRLKGRLNKIHGCSVDW